LEALADIDDERYICAAREMTKAHEEYLRGSVREVKMMLTNSAERGTLLGEFSVFVSGKKSP